MTSARFSLSLASLPAAVKRGIEELEERDCDWQKLVKENVWRFYMGRGPDCLLSLATNKPYKEAVADWCPPGEDWTRWVVDRGFDLAVNDFRYTELTHLWRKAAGVTWSDWCARWLGNPPCSGRGR